MSKRRDQDYLNDICEAIQRVVSYTEEMTNEQFINDTRTQDAVVRNLEVIGEATKNLSTRIKRAYVHIPWKSLAGSTYFYVQELGTAGRWRRKEMTNKASHSEIARIQ